APMALMLAFTSSLYCSLTQYTHARGPILFGAGYVPTGVWWRTLPLDQMLKGGNAPAAKSDNSASNLLRLPPSTKSNASGASNTS
ncbi:anion permease, partial [Salmonella enterica subsp. enterica serovar Kentucky]|nr:anion permease [Salmonella enterica subsp. enterica serovar Kentucky]